MATYNYYKENRDMITYPTMKRGSNWIRVVVDFAKQNMAANDVLKLFPVKNHWIIKSGTHKVIVASDGNATGDLGITSGGQELDAGFDQQADATTWGPLSVVLDNAPVACTADTYVYFENLAAACVTGSFEFLFEIVISPTDADSLTMGWA